MADVFISYAREDRESARRLAEVVESHGWTVWWDRRIPAGKAYEDVIDLEIEEAGCVLVLWTQRSVTSAWVRNEAAEGLRRQRLIPIRLEEVRVPLSYRHLQVADLLRWTSSELEDCLASIKKMIESANNAAMAESPSDSPSPSEQEREQTAHWNVKPELVSLLRGVSKLADIVKVAFGPKGRNVAVKRSNGGTILTTDFRTIANEFRLPDPIENMGAHLARDVATKTRRTAGDGATTTVILAQSIFSEGLKAMNAGARSAALKRGIQFAVEVATKSLEKQSNPVVSGKVVAQVGTISADNDDEIGNLIALAIEKVGNDGAITVEESRTLETWLDVAEGTQFDRGYLSPDFVTDPERMEVVLENPLILIHEKKISSMKELLPVLEQVARLGRSLLVIAEDIEGEALATLVVNKVRGTLQVAAVKAPGFGDRRKAILEDIAILSGGKAVTEDFGLKLENIAVELLGKARRVIINSDTTTIFEGSGSPAAIDTRVRQLRAQVEAATSDYDHEKLEERLAKLVGGVAVIKVGASSEIEMKAKKVRVEDALCAAKTAVDQGVVPGAGVAFIRCIAALQRLSAEADEQIGVDIVKGALEQPLRVIAGNGGFDADEAIQLAQGMSSIANVPEPTHAVRLVLQNASAIAVHMLTTETVIAEVPQKTPFSAEPLAYLPAATGQKTELMTLWLGVHHVSEAVRGTFGPRGRNAIIQRKDGNIIVTREGAAVVEYLELQDAQQNMGVQLVREAATRSLRLTGSGTVTTILLAESILAGCTKAANKSLNLTTLAGGIQKAARCVSDAIQRLSRPVSGNKVERVATISANDDDVIGNLIASAIEKVGSGGVITVEESRTLETWLDVVEGTQFDRGYLSPDFVTDPENMEVVLENPLILIHQKKIGSMKELLPVLEQVARLDRPLLVIAEDVESEVLATLVVNKVRGTLQVAAVKAPGFGDRRKAMLEDLAILSGGKALTEGSDLKLEKVTVEHLGKARKVTIDSNNTTIIEGGGTSDAIEGRIRQLRAEVEATASDYDREKLQERLAKLVGGVVVIKVGATTKTEMKERKECIEEALRAAKAAIEEGVVPGCALVFVRASFELKSLRVSGDEQIGVEIVRRACEEPLRQLCFNADRNWTEVIELIGNDMRSDYGFNAVSGRHEDLVQAGIVDTAQSARLSFENAAALAVRLLTTEKLMA